MRLRGPSPFPRTRAPTVSEAGKSTAPSSTAPSSTAPSSTAPSSTAPSSTAPSSTVSADVGARSAPVASGDLARLLEVEKARHGQLRQDLEQALRAGTVTGVAASRRVTEHADRLLAVLDDQVQKELGPPPLDPGTGAPTGYAFFGAGSYGRLELTPYSDLDFGVVVTADSQAMQAWMKRHVARLTVLMKAVAGDAFAPCREMSPLGSMGAFLYGTPQELARRAAGQSGDLATLAPREREFITTALCTSRLALGRGEGGDAYRVFDEELRAHLGPAAPHVDAGSPRAVLVDGLLGGMRDPFGVPEREPGWLGDDDQSTRRPTLKKHQPIAPFEAIAQGKVNVKHDLLRALQLPVAALRALHDVGATSGDEVLAVLAERGQIDPGFAHKLRESLEVCLRLRALNQLALKAPVDKLQTLDDGDRRALRTMVPVLYRLRQGLEPLKRDKNAPHLT